MQPLVVQNPWIDTTVSGAVTVTISADVLAKFWMQLADSPVVFTVDGAIGVAHSDDTCARLLSRPYKDLGLTSYAQYIVLPGNSPYMGVGQVVEGTWTAVNSSSVIDALSYTTQEVTV